MNRKTVFALLFLAFTGCLPPDQTIYVFRLVRPDGTIHKEVRSRVAHHPWVSSSSRGQVVYGPIPRLPDAPIGWLWEIAPVAEKEDK